MVLPLSLFHSFWLLSSIYACMYAVASVMADSLWPYGLQATGLTCPCDSPGKNTGVGCHALLQGIFPIQGSDPCLPRFLFGCLVIPGECDGTALQCSCLENPRDGGAWWAAVYGVAQSWTWLKRLSSSSSSNRYPFFFFLLCLIHVETPGSTLVFIENRFFSHRILFLS